MDLACRGVYCPAIAAVNLVRRRSDGREHVSIDDLQPFPNARRERKFLATPGAALKNPRPRGTKALRLPVMSDRIQRDQAYWRANVRLVLGLLAVWFAVSFGGGIVFADWLDRFRFFGFRLGFWVSQQGSILVFVALIFVYVVRMNALDRRHDVHEDEETH